jgi:hypothetical protein
MVLQQLSFGGVKSISYCSRCKKPLSNPTSVEAGMGPICRGHGGKEMQDECKRTEFADEGLEMHVPLTKALVLVRDGAVRTNVPHLVVHHSPSGFDWGYGGSGPADLALNICQWYLLSIGYDGLKSQCFDGHCFSLAYALHQDFKWEFIAKAPRNGAAIPMAEIKGWFDAHITDGLKALYEPFKDE